MRSGSDSNILGIAWSDIRALSLMAFKGCCLIAAFCFAVALIPYKSYALTTPTLTVSTSGTPSTYGSAVTFTATISSGPTGTITILDGGTSIGSGAIGSGSATFTISSLSAGSHTITASWPGNSNYNSVTSSAITQIVNQATPTITWTTPAAITYGAALSSTQLNATASVAGSFGYAPAASTVLPPGSQTLTASFSPTDTTDYTTAASSVTLTVLAIPPAGIVITFAGDGYWGYYGDGGPAIDAGFETVKGVTIDAAGNIYIPDGASFVVRKVSASTGMITTIAGNGTSGYSGDNGPATSAELAYPTAVALDASGNIYIADSGNDVIREINASTGVISTIAGNGSIGYGGDGGPATSAPLGYSLNITLDGAGNLYIADMYFMVVRQVSAATGIITTVAGNGSAGYSGDGGPATSAELNWPCGLAVDPIGNIYIADFDNNVIREVIAATGNISTVAGTGIAGYSGDNGPAGSSELSGPYAVSLDAAGNLYISDTANQVVRQVSPPGTISTVAGNGTGGFSGDGGPATSAELDIPAGTATDSSGNLYIADVQNLRVRLVGSNVTEPVTTEPTITWGAPTPITYGTALSAIQLNATASVAGTFSYEPASGAVLSAGLHSLTVVFSPTDTVHYGPAMAVVPLTVNQASPVITWGTPAPIPYGVGLSSTQLNASTNVPGTFTYAPSTGTILFSGSQTLSATFTPADTVDYTSTTATVTLIVSTNSGSADIFTFAGNGTGGYSGDGGSALQAELTLPGSVKADASGNLYIRDWGSDVIRKVDGQTRIIQTVAGNGQEGFSGDGGPATNAMINNPSDLAFDPAGNLYIADQGNNRIRKIDLTTGIISTVAGNGTAGYTGDGGAAIDAELNSPCGVVFDSAGNMYISDFSNQVIRKVSAQTGFISTVVGNGIQGYSRDGGPAISAKLNQPGYLAIDASGNLYLQDWGNDVIREVNISDGNISTVAGDGTLGYSGDGGPATSAEFKLDGNIVVDSAGNLYITDSGNNVIRSVSASSGLTSTIAGDGVAGYAGDGGPAVNAELNQPEGIGLDAGGNLYIADFGNNRVRVVGSIASASAVTVSLSPLSATLYSGQSQQFTATVTNTGNTGVTWSISPSGTGAINSSGLYTAPATIGSQQTVTITAASQANSSVAASAVVTLMPPITVSVSPTVATLSSGQTQQFSATVTNTSNTEVTWSISP